MNDKLSYLIADAAVRELHVRYADAVWRQDFAAFGDCFSVDCEWRTGGKIMRGRKSIVEGFREIVSHFDRILLTFRSPMLQVSDGAAAARTYVNEMTARKSGGPSTAIGLYYERFVDEGDRWRFKWRLWQTLYRGNADLTGSFFEFEDFGAPPAMPAWETPFRRRTFRGSQDRRPRSRDSVFDRQVTVAPPVCVRRAL
jgi:ketosteroid isomerase-like protein